LTLKQAEKSFKEKSTSMLAANYQAKNLDDMIPTHLMMSPLGHIEETFHSIFWKTGKSTSQTSSS
jgi:hypothetical protein